MGFVILILSYISLVVHVCFVTISFAAGIYYISEIVEEYSERTKKVIRFVTFTTIGFYLLLLITESFSWTIIICGILSQVVHLAILRTFPNIKILSLEFWSAVSLLLFNHYLAYKHFQEAFYPLSEILGYFTLCLWLVPFALFVSLSANDQVLPSYQEVPGHDHDGGDVVTNYFSSRKRQNLLNFFKSAKSSILPTRRKKSF